MRSVQGLTELLPVSSSGQLKIGPVLFGTSGEENLTFAIVVHNYIVRYKYENEIEIQQVFLHIKDVIDDSFNIEDQFNCKFWTPKQISLELDSGIFSDKFEKELALLANVFK